MVYCLNPDCSKPENPDNNKICHGCHENLDRSSQEYILKLRYKIIKKLGEGAFGRTYLAQDIHLMDEKKVIKKLINNIPKATELFKREAKRLYELEHPQIPKLHAYFEHQNSFYLVQEFVEGDTLFDEVWQQGRFDEGKIQQLLMELLPVLDYLHQQKILHRDIKPENIMRRVSNNKSGEERKKELVLIDFGASKQVSTKMKSIQGTKIFTPGYAAIEQILGSAKPASDIYSLGATAVRLLTQCFPDSQDEYGNTIDNLLVLDGNNINWRWKEYAQEQRININPDLAAILDKMLAQNISDRYQSAEAVLNDLNSLESSQTNNTIISKTLITPSPPTPNNSVNVSKKTLYQPTFFPPAVPPRRKRKKLNKPNKELRNQIAIIGPRPSGKLTYLASFAYFTNLVKNSPVESIIPKTKDTISFFTMIEDILMKRGRFMAMYYSPEGFYSYRNYQFLINIKEQSFMNIFKNNKPLKELELFCSCLPGELFRAISKKDHLTIKAVTDFIEYFQNVELLILVDGNLPKLEIILTMNATLKDKGKHQKLEEILFLVKQRFQEIYQQNLVNLILFGSQARGEATLESDIDILVILKTAKPPQEKHKKTIDFISDMCIEYGALVSCVYVSEKQFNYEKSPLLLNIHREGIIL